MIDLNNVVLIGRATRDPELRYIPSGTAVCNFNLAVDKGLSKSKKEEFEAQGKPTADFINIVTWNKTAEFVGQYLGKGNMVAVQGSLQSGKYEDKDGKTVYTTDVNAFNVKVLEWKSDNNKAESNTEDMEGFAPTSSDDIPF